MKQSRTPREAICISLSDLFLDTDVSRFYDRILDDIDASPLDDAAIERLLFDAVAPAMAVNLASVAGEWAGFDPEWVLQRIESVKGKRVTAFVGKLTAGGYARQQWRRLMARRAERDGA